MCKEKLYEVIRDIPQFQPRQDSTLDQLRDLEVIANKLGCYDAADLISNIIDGR